MTTNRPPAVRCPQRVITRSLVVAVLTAAGPLWGQDASGPTSKPLVSTVEQMKGQDPLSVNVTVLGHFVEPKKVPASDENVAKLKLPPGFKIARWNETIVRPRMIVVAADGTTYVSSRETGRLTMLKDADRDGKADGRGNVVAEKRNLHGVALSPDGKTMYVTTIREVYSTTVAGDGSLGELKEIYSGLPDAGQHPNRTLAVGPVDGKLYLSVGSTANATDEKNPEAATMLIAEPDGSGRKIFAQGLRNTIGFGWHPLTRELWGADHGIDWLGDDEQPEELNRIEQGKHYGWPYIYADGRFNPQDDPAEGQTMQGLSDASVKPTLMYTAHAAPMQMTFYTGDMFPPEYKNDAFIAMRGSWNRKTPSGYEVVRVRFDKGGKPVAMEPFLTGFLQRTGEGAWTQFARLAGCAQLPDGSLLVGDDSNGVIYRVYR